MVFRNTAARSKRAVSTFLTAALALSTAWPTMAASTVLSPQSGITTGETDEYGVFKHFINLPYAALYNDEDHNLDLFLPAPSTKPAPLVVFIHGGGWFEGNKDHCPARSLVKEGFAVASVNYRLTDTAPFPAQLQDCKAAIRYLRANSKQYNIDPDHIGVWGMSAGGHLAALLGTAYGEKRFADNLGYPDTPDKVQAVVDWYGPTDFLRFNKKQLESRMVRKAVTGLLGGTPLEKKELARDASPVYFVNKNAPPFLIMHGTTDNVVPIDQSRELAAKLRSKGVPVQFVVVPNQGHVMFGDDYTKQVRAFFVKTLKDNDETASADTTAQN